MAVVTDKENNKHIILSEQDFRYTLAKLGGQGLVDALDEFYEVKKNETTEEELDPIDDYMDIEDRIED